MGDHLTRSVLSVCFFVDQSGKLSTSLPKTLWHFLFPENSKRFPYGNVAIKSRAFPEFFDVHVAWIFLFWKDH